MAVLFGLTAALIYGAADFIGGIASRRAAAVAVVVLSQAAGLVLMLCILPFFPMQISAAGLWWGAAAGLCGGVGITLFYAALASGRMGIVSPLTAIPAAALPVAAGALRGEPLGTLQLSGIALALAATALVSAAPGEASGGRRALYRSVLLALGSGVLLGGFYIFLAYAGPAGGLLPLVGARCASLLFIAGAAAVTRTAMPRSRPLIGLIAAGGLLDGGANVLYLLSLHAGTLAIAAVLTSLYPASTVLLARYALGERLRRRQKAGVLCAIFGAALIAS